ncbi:MAG: hypothetical protein EGQ35_07050 [Clostridiales bacterium]|mgnify:CR=1 FL=1|nr:hypothetical protein [Clostridiales bacterium]
MKEDKLKKLILSLNQDIVFKYNGKDALINPLNKNKFEVGFGDVELEYNDIDKLMNDNIFDGKSLAEICTEINIEPA